MNKKAFWFGIKANIAAGLMAVILFMLVGYAMGIFGFGSLITGNVYTMAIAVWIFVIIGYYIALNTLLKNSKDSKDDKITGLKYTWYIYFVYSFIVFLFNINSKLGIIWILFTTIASCLIVFAVCQLILNKQKNIK